MPGFEQLETQWFQAETELADGVKVEEKQAEQEIGLESPAEDGDVRYWMIFGLRFTRKSMAY